MRSGPQPDDADFGRNLRRVQVLTRLFGLVLALAIVGTAIYAVVKGIQEEPSIVGSLATAMAAVLAVVYGQQRQANLDQKRAHREKLEPIYEELIERFRGDGPNNPKEAKRFFSKLMTRLLMNGSDEFLQVWVEFQRTSPEWEDMDAEEATDAGAAQNLLRWEKVLRAIRSDLGHSNEGLAEGDLLRTYINDIDLHLPKAKN